MLRVDSVALCWARSVLASNNSLRRDLGGNAFHLPDECLPIKELPGESPAPFGFLHVTRRDRLHSFLEPGVLLEQVFDLQPQRGLLRLGLVAPAELVAEVEQGLLALGTHRHHAYGLVQWVVFVVEVVLGCLEEFF